MRSITRSYRIRTYPNGAQRRLRDRWFGAYRWLWNTALEIRTAAYQECGLTLTGIDISRWLTQWKRTEGHEWLNLVPATCIIQCLRDQDKTCSKCRHVLDELRLDVRFWTCPKCNACHDRDINAARNLLMEGFRQLAARDGRDLCVDAGDACPEEILVQVLAEEARSGQRNRACMEQARF
jgi:transposase